MYKSIAISMALISVLLLLNITIFRNKLMYTVIVSLSILIISANVVSKVLKNNK